MYIYCMYNPTISMYTSNGFAKARFKDAGDQEAVSFLMVKKAIAVWWILPSQSKLKREQNSCFSQSLELQLRDRTSLSVYISLSRFSSHYFFSAHSDAYVCTRLPHLNIFIPSFL